LALALLALCQPAPARCEPIPFAPGDSLETLREKIAANGYHFTVKETWISRLPEAEREAMRTRGLRGQGARANRTMARSDTALTRTASLPAAFDWRDVGGKNYVGAVRDQGGCGSCYAFAAAAVAEGVYNVATRRSGAAGVDFSEQYIAFCLGKIAAYNDHFYGCGGADYSYSELLALTVEGLITEAALPYSGYATSCPQTTTGNIVFSGWGRAGCQDTTAIKAAILANGPVDAAVLTNPVFDAYGSGVFQDGTSGCPDPYHEGCDYTPTDHAIALVGWNDGDGQTPGHFILRNSWGTDWGEDGYMRIAYDTARVSCSVAYLTYPAAPAAIPQPHLPLLLQ
jgi:C1A family cysteine protease